MKNLLVVCILMMAPVFGQQPLTPEGAIALGLKNNFDIRIARNSAEAAKNSAGLGTAELLPTISASGGYTLSQARQETNSPFSFGDTDTENINGSIALNWTIFDGFRMFAEKGRQSALARLGEKQSRNTIENTVVGILSGYLNLVRQEQLLAVARQAMDISKERLDKEQVRRDIGGSSSTDLLNARVAYNIDQSTFLNQELQVVIARNALNVLLGQAPETPLMVVNEILLSEFEGDFENLLSAARARNSRLAVAREDLTAARMATRGSAARFSPTVALNGSYGYSDRTTTRIGLPATDPAQDVITESKDGVLGLSLTWNLFNGFRDKISFQNAKISARNSALALQKLENQIAGEVREKFLTYQQRLTLLSLERENLAAAEQNLALQEDRYRLGATTSLEYRDAQVSLIRAQTALITARYQARIAQLEIEQLTGQLKIE